jgi:tetratricopeptide (TPR) repeat protein
MTPTAVAVSTIAVMPTTAALPTTEPLTALEREIAALRNQAFAARQVNNYDEAIDLYTQVLELDPTLSSVWLSRAVSRELIDGESENSRQDFWQYLQLVQTETIERDIVVNEPLELKMVEGRVYALSFEAQSGDTLDVTAKNVRRQGGPTVIFDSLVLLMLDETVLRANDDTLASDGNLSLDSYIDHYKVLRDGTYTILLGHAGRGSYGKVEVTVSVR